MSSKIVTAPVTLLQYALAAPKASKRYKDSVQYFVQFAISPEHIGPLSDIVVEGLAELPVNMRQVSPTMVRQNSKMPQPFDGVPDDHYIIRASSNYAVDCLAADGTSLNQEQIRQQFYSGCKVRILLSTYRREMPEIGISFGLHGVLFDSDAPRRHAFAQYINKSAASTPQVNPFAPHQPAKPFGTAAAEAAAALAAQHHQANPFAPQASPQAAPQATSNPFAPQPQHQDDPFAAKLLTTN